MKRLFAILCVCCICWNITAQERKPLPVTVEVGTLLYSSASNDSSLDPISLADIQSQFLYGAYVQVIFPTKYKVLNWMVGANIVAGENRIYQMNGGAVYAGIRTRMGGQNFAFISEFAAGIYSIKNYNAYYHSGITDIEADYTPLLQASTFGGQFGFGVEFGFGKINFAPQISMMVTGGSNTSFLFSGIKLPLTITF